MCRDSELLGFDPQLSVEPTAESGFSFTGYSSD